MIEVLPDIQFKKELRRVSKAPLNECIQCGTCSVVCSLAPDEKPFPRKEMIWAGWGMKEKLIANPDVWLCYQCGDCSTYCPRGVKPSEVLAGVRQIAYRQYARPGFLGEIMSHPKWLPVALLIPVVIISVILKIAGTLSIPEGPVNYSKFFPHAWLNVSFTLLTFFSYGLAYSGLKKFWKDIKMQFPDFQMKKSFFHSFRESLITIFSHSRFGKCSSQKSRKVSHFLVFYGFVLLLFVTAYAIVATITHHYPLGFLNPFKIAGNVAGLMLIAGLGIMIFNRLFNRKNFGSSNYSDWLLLVSLFLLTVSGLVIEMARFLNWGSAYHLYFLHLVCVWFVIIYLPYTKFGHLIYRTLAMMISTSIGRN
ncbi:MAG: quinone-interacting membrane-bound oxidoreductase complex subunit QmoC [Bacteroidales bacterium]|nr:quinone-interacting membrane-bound oxidoreductase complex subunit QmoC [Bacteroidales bacterium]